ncbi:MAG: hypothetical protein LC772_09995 [Chloroflexi bacterium]|nr:hypothetical protein [Chloroflexota bacterium]
MLDRRLPIGLFFVVIGAILVFGGVTHPVREQGFLIDLDWGIVLLVFGALMAIAGRRATAPEPADEQGRAAAVGKP